MSNFNEENEISSNDISIKNDNRVKVIKEIKKEPNLNYNEQPVHPSKYSDSDNSEDEGMEDYKIGGYHPVHVG